MKNNTKTYLLIVTVLGIWGTIGYQIISGLSLNEPEVVQNNLDIAFSPKTNAVVDTFSIQTVNRAPFLGTLTRKASGIKTRSTRKQNAKDTTWLPIVYNGLVKRQNSTQSVFVVNINGSQHLIKKGQTVNDVTLIRGSEKEVLVRYKNKRKIIFIQ